MFYVEHMTNIPKSKKETLGLSLFFCYIFYAMIKYTLKSKVYPTNIIHILIENITTFVYFFL